MLKFSSETPIFPGTKKQVYLVATTFSLTIKFSKINFFFSPSDLHYSSSDALYLFLLAEIIGGF